MRNLVLATLLLAAACRTGSLGQCSRDSDCPSGARCDPSEHVCAVRAGDCFPACGTGLTCQSTACVDVTPPSISAITLTTPPDFPPSIYKGQDGSTLAVSAQISDVSGVQNVCLQVAGETGCPHTGTNAGGGVWTFTMPRAPTSGSLDGTPVSFTIAADDAPSGRPPNHGTATGVVRFDNAGPSIQIAADPQPHARSEEPIQVAVTINDTTGVCETGSCRPKLTVGGIPSFFSGRDGGAFLFDLDATKATAGVEGPLGFTITAQDSLGHQSVLGGSRFVDDKAPVVTLKVFRDGDTEPSSDAGFPPAAPNTGYDGHTFLYSDVVHVKGTVQDDGGIGSVSWRIDGVAIGGAVSTGTSNPVCDGGTSCSFDVTVALNAPGNGELHTTTADLESHTNVAARSGTTLIPAAELQVVLTAADQSQTSQGIARANTTLRPVALKATRFLWLANLPTGNTVHGLALHPNGDLIATTQSTASGSVFALPTQGRPLADGGFPIDWSFAAGGNIVDMPAVGAGDAATSLVYVATTDGGVFALRPDGGEAWRATGLQQLWTAPALVSAPAGETVVIPSVSPTTTAAANLYTLRSAGNGTAIVTDAGIDDDDVNSAPLVLDGGVYFGTVTSLYRFNFADAGLVKANAGGEIWSPVTDGGVVYTATTAAPAGSLSTFTQALALANPSVPVAGAVNQDFIVDMTGRVLAATTTSRLVSIDTADGGVRDVGIDLEPPGDGKIPLQGSDGTIYLPRSTGFLLAFRDTDGRTSWTFDPSGSIFRALAMDCAGRLYVATNDTIYALITDDRGLADAPWPTYRRDSRATGNFGAPRYGIRLPGPDGGVCDN